MAGGAEAGEREGGANGGSRTEYPWGFSQESKRGAWGQRLRAGRLGEWMTPQEQGHEIGRGGLEVVRPLEDGDVLRQVLFVDAPEGPQEITQPRPDPFGGVAVDLADAVAVIVARPLVSTGFELVAHLLSNPPVLGEPVVATPFVRVDDGSRSGALEHLGMDFPCSAGMQDLKGKLPGRAIDHAQNRDAVVFPAAVSLDLIASLARRIFGIGMRRTFFPPRSGTTRRLR